MESITHTGRWANSIDLKGVQYALKIGLLGKRNLAYEKINSISEETKPILIISSSKNADILLYT